MIELSPDSRISTVTLEKQVKQLHHTLVIANLKSNFSQNFDTVEHSVFNVTCHPSAIDFTHRNFFTLNLVSNSKFPCFYVFGGRFATPVSNLRKLVLEENCAHVSTVSIANGSIIAKPACYHASTLVNGHLYVFGGLSKDNTAPMNQMTAFDVAKRKWRLVKHAPNSLVPGGKMLHSMTLAQDGKTIWIFGGVLQYDLALLDELLIFNLETLEYSIISDQKGAIGRHSHSAHFFNDYFYVVGGKVEEKNKNLTLHRLDKKTYQWNNPISTDSIITRYQCDTSFLLLDTLFLLCSLHQKQSLGETVFITHVILVNLNFHLPVRLIVLDYGMHITSSSILSQNSFICSESQIVHVFKSHYFPTLFKQLTSAPITNGSKLIFSKEFTNITIISKN